MDKKIIIDLYLKIIDINGSHNFFLYRFLSIDIGNRYSSMIDVDYYRLWSINYVWLIVIYLSEANGKITF